MLRAMGDAEEVAYQIYHFPIYLTCCPSWGYANSGTVPSLWCQKHCGATFVEDWASAVLRLSRRTG